MRMDLILLLVILVLLVLYLCTYSVKEPFAGSSSYSRGAGKPVHTCPPGTERQNGLCYTACRKGYDGKGPICWTGCPDGYTDSSVGGCHKPPSYGRTAGYPTQSFCERRNGTPDNPGGTRGMRSKKGELATGCEKWGDLWYPKCGKGYHAFGCCICSPDCPEGTVDIGATCVKKTYGRGFGKPMKCDSNTEDLNGALCYPKCNAKDGKVYEGKGPTCWRTGRDAPKPGATVTTCPGWDCDVPGTTCSADDGYCCTVDKKWIPGECQ